MLAKQITGLPGDSIALVEGRVYVNGFDKGALLEVSRSGLPLHPLEHTVVQEGHVFVSGTHPESFDSRYLEFGLVPIEDLEECLKPIF